MGEDHHNGLFYVPSKGLTQRGASVTNLKQCRAFYLAYQKIRQTVSGESSSMSNAQALDDIFVLE